MKDNMLFSVFERFEMFLPVFLLQFPDMPAHEFGTAADRNQNSVMRYKSNGSRSGIHLPACLITKGLNEINANVHTGNAVKCVICKYGRDQ